MSTKDEQFLKHLRSIFRVEAAEHIGNITSGLMDLEKNPDRKKFSAIVETIFREAHSLKGAARSVNMREVETVCQIIENILGVLKKEHVNLKAEQFDLLHNALDYISSFTSGETDLSPQNSEELLTRLKTIFDDPRSKKSNLKLSYQEQDSTSEKIDSSTDSDPAYREEFRIKKSQLIETVRIPTSKLDPLFLQAEQLIQAKIVSAQRIKEVKMILNLVELWKKEFSKLYLFNDSYNDTQYKELIDLYFEKISELDNMFGGFSHELENDYRLINRLIDDHVESVKSVLMLPVVSMVEGFPKFVRDLSRSQAKDVELVINGSELEVDKRLLEELKDPLIHLLRNCIDHGIKNPLERKNINKPPSGKITLSFNVAENQNLEIIISDDGEGIDIEKVGKAAIKKGLVSGEKLSLLNSREIMFFIFQSEITTSKIISDISGRGLGLAIVKEIVEKLGGSISVESVVNIGTNFRILVPLTFSTFRGVLVKSYDQLFVIPSMYVKRTKRVKPQEIKTVKNKDTILIDSEILTIIKLDQVLNLNNTQTSSQRNNKDSLNGFHQTLVLAHSGNKFALMVDEVLEENQILLKKLGPQLNRVLNISGATILGNGKVVPVINVPDLLKSALRTTIGEKVVAESFETKEKHNKILVIDDSITARTLIKNIIESAGYNVETAIDGVDGFTKALIGEFDLVVSDVDMPRMNGFELTAKIRKDKKLSQLPVILVTALETREDREHGIDVGADAYIVKSSFEHSNLLEVIKKLI